MHLLRAARGAEARIGRAETVLERDVADHQCPARRWPLSVATRAQVGERARDLAVGARDTCARRHVVRGHPPRANFPDLQRVRSSLPRLITQLQEPPRSLWHGVSLVAVGRAHAVAARGASARVQSASLPAMKYAGGNGMARSGAARAAVVMHRLVVRAAFAACRRSSPLSPTLGCIRPPPHLGQVDQMRPPRPEKPCALGPGGASLSFSPARTPSSPGLVLFWTIG